MHHEPASRRALLVALAWLATFPASAWGVDANEITQTTEAQRRVSEANAIGRAYMGAIDRFHAANSALPGSKEELNFDQGTPGSIKEVRVTADGVIEVYLTGHHYVEGGALTFTPRSNPDGSLSWKCGRMRLEERLVPISCRE